MKCEICHQNEAAVHFKQLCNGSVKELYVCEACAAENGFDAKSPLSMTDFLFGVGLQTQRKAGEGKACPVCGMRGTDFRKRQRLGCATCYETFADDLTAHLAAAQKGSRHVGKTPAAASASPEAAALEKALKKAVSRQDFEEAAQLRDRIMKLKGGA